MHPLCYEARRACAQVFTGASSLDLELTVREGPAESLECTLYYNQDLFDEATVQRMLGHLMVRARQRICAVSQISCASSAS